MSGLGKVRMHGRLKNGKMLPKIILIIDLKKRTRTQGLIYVSHSDSTGGTRVVINIQGTDMHTQTYANTTKTRHTVT